ncbi:MAG TPA: hypothetical protein VLS90_12540, partial [Thermodesulfobacteriota bacterium]|nr:hypothetical protein [Thermodesulfobacteriota bacterium]
GTRIREHASEFGIRILTDDWSLYDADHAVTETDGVSAREVEEYAKSFFGKLSADIEEMKDATLKGTYRGPFREEMEKRLEVDFAWKLMAGDLLETQGRISREEVSGNGGPLPSLAARFADSVSMPAFFVQEKLEKLVNRGLIRCRTEGDVFRWEWKE